MLNRYLRASALLVLPLLWSCSEGGSEEPLTSDVPINADHHLVGFVGRAAFPEFPVNPNDTGTLRSTLRMLSDSTYSIFDTAGTLAEGDYFLQFDSRLSLTIPTTGVTQVLRGSYGLGADTGHVFITDRVGSGIGLEFGTLRQSGTPAMADFAGDWHLFSLLTIYADAGELPTADLIARAFAGDLTLAADGSASGTGVESTNLAATLAISSEVGGVKAFDGHEFELPISYGSGPAAVERSFLGGGTSAFLATVDQDPRDGAEGLMVMMRHRSAGAVDAASLAGTYVLGIWTMFADPRASGVDAALGELELNESGAFRIEATNNRGEVFTYSGTYAAEDDGSLTFTVSGTDETWYGAFDDAYESIVFSDPFKEQRAAPSQAVVELSLGIALREQDV